MSVVVIVGRRELLFIMFRICSFLDMRKVLIGKKYDKVEDFI